MENKKTWQKKDGVLAVITGVVAAVCKNRKKYTKVRTNY